MDEPDDGTLQDLASAARANLYYGLESLKQALRGSVEIGKICLKNPDRVFPGLEDQNVRQIHILSATRFPDPDRFSDTKWRQLEAFFDRALDLLMRSVDESVKPSKRWRAQQMLRLNPMAGIALLTLLRRDD